MAQYSAWQAASIAFAQEQLIETTVETLIETSTVETCEQIFDTACLEGHESKASQAAEAEGAGEAGVPRLSEAEQAEALGGTGAEELGDAEDPAETEVLEAAEAVVKGSEPVEGEGCRAENEELGAAEDEGPAEPEGFRAAEAQDPEAEGPTETEEHGVAEAQEHGDAEAEDLEVAENEEFRDAEAEGLRAEAEAKSSFFGTTQQTFEGLKSGMDDSEVEKAYAQEAPLFEEMSVSALKQYLDQRGVTYADCVEKFHLVHRAKGSD